MDFSDEYEIEIDSDGYGLRNYAETDDASFYVPSAADIEEIYRLMEGNPDLQYRSILEEIA
jgi:hypothetical protein